MTLNKAIEHLNHHRIPLKTASNHDFFTAILLGIEALKAWQSSRNFSSIHQVPLLPGETEDNDFYLGKTHTNRLMTNKRKVK